MNHHHHHSLIPAPAGIPLHCNICPKKPDFSDVSHLLTHIGSKAHLSNYFKTKVKAATDAVSKRTVEEYDDWYEEWNVQDMMSERFDQKERKKSGTAAARGGNDLRRASGANSVASSRNTPLVSDKIGRRFRENTLDPQLGPRIKQEPKSRSATPASGYTLDAAVFHRSYAPPMQNWPTTPYGATPMRQGRSIIDSIYTTPSSGSGETDLPTYPYDHGNRRNFSGSTRSIVYEDDVEFDDTLNDSMKLKGVIWPGMDLFDSATPDMRRKRNQKKAISVVQSLKATSEIVEATEQIFDQDGVLVRERPITGNPEEEDGRSPLPGEFLPSPECPPPKKKPARRARPALTEKNVNTGRVTRGGRDRRAPPPSRSSRATPYFDFQDGDDDLTYGRHPKRRTGLSIHRDNTGPEITFDHPAPMNVLNSSFRNPFQSSMGAPFQNGLHSRTHQRQPSFSYGQDMRTSHQNHHHLGLPPPNFGSFGHLNGASLFQNSGFHTPNTNPNNNLYNFSSSSHQQQQQHQAFATFQQHFGLGPQQPLNNDPPTTTTNSNLFSLPPQGQNAALQSQNPWDFLGSFGQPDLGLPTTSSGTGGVDVSNFHLNADFASVNPLFISSGARGGPDDDEATVSPPSEH